MKFYRIYASTDAGNFVGTFETSECANNWFTEMKEKGSPFFTCELLDETGKILQSKTYGEPCGASTRGQKGHAQQLVNLIKYNIEFKMNDAVLYSLTHEEAAQYIIDAAGKEEGFGTKWVYLTEPSHLVDYI